MDEILLERIELVRERLATLADDFEGPDKEYFSYIAGYIKKLYEMTETDLRARSLEQCHADEDFFYGDMKAGRYENSFFSHKYSVEKFGEKKGQCLSALLCDVAYMATPAAFQKDFEVLQLYSELTLLVAGIISDGSDDEEIRKAIYSFYHDNCELFDFRQVSGLYTVGGKISEHILQDELSDARSLYLLGYYIGEDREQIYNYLATLSQETIDGMAATYVEGYRKGFEVTGRDLSIKDTVQMEFPIGFDRMARAAYRKFNELGLGVAIRQENLHMMTGRGGRRRGYNSAPVNRQMDYDHKDDNALIINKSLLDRRLEVIKDTLSKTKEAAAAYGGPALVETFGAMPFSPEIFAESPVLSKEQQQLKVYFSSKNGQLIDEFVHEDETSFTIISYPTPAIGENFEEVFAEISAINNMDYEVYKDIQQNIIEVLDKGEKVHVTGRDGNETDIWVALHHLDDVKKQTNFENCIADVNIPLGEVFTSPVLKGTNGLLHVKKVFLMGMGYENLRITFKDGMIADYSCTNLKDPAECRKIIEDNILHNHKTLPLGEFAIGTNTRAYTSARKLGIEDRLDILIAEKTGPHFAVGDTCYSHAEEVPMYNPDGRECIARSNEVADLRDTDRDKAYFNCHTDITIPYDELKDIEVTGLDGVIYPIIKEGRFVTKGNEELNKYIDC